MLVHIIKKLQNVYIIIGTNVCEVERMFGVKFTRHLVYILRTPLFVHHILFFYKRKYPKVQISIRIPIQYAHLHT